MPSPLSSLLARFGFAGEAVPPEPRQRREGDGPGTELLHAIDDLDELVSLALPVPLTEVVRVDPRLLRATAGRLRPAATEAFGNTGPVADVFTVIGELEEEVTAARNVPLTGQVRVDKRRVLELTQRLRGLARDALAERDRG